jgi:anti-sigma regulatory factor (Ser/Thr protein kinase)
MPWIAARVGLEQDSVAAVKTCFEEIFHNIKDHSGVTIGCAFAQFFEGKEQIHVAISDFGLGIPAVVRGKLPTISDKEALRKACEEGFTTQSNVRNRGAGIPTLMRYVTLRNKGTVFIFSGKAEIAATFEGGTKFRAKEAKGIYPGTLVSVLLRTDTFEAMATDVEAEEFKW